MPRVVSFTAVLVTRPCVRKWPARSSPFAHGSTAPGSAEISVASSSAHNHMPVCNCKEDDAPVSTHSQVPSSL